MNFFFGEEEDVEVIITRFYLVANVRLNIYS